MQEDYIRRITGGTLDFTKQVKYLQRNNGRSRAGYQFYVDDVLLPITPSKLTVKIKNQNKTLNLINEGEVNLLKKPGLSAISFSALLPYDRGYPFSHYKSSGQYNAISYYLDKLESLKTGGNPFEFRVIRTGPDIGRVFLNFNTVFIVSLEDYTITEDAAQYGRDAMVAVNLLQYRAFNSKVLTVNSDAGTATTTTTRDTSTKPTVTQYTVLQGDTLIKISQKTLGDGSRWKEIYTLNQEAIEKNAKDHGLASSSNGARIDPGLVLKIPG